MLIAMTWRRQTLAALGAAVAVLAGCTSSGVQVTRSDDHQPATTTPATTTPDTTIDSVVPSIEPVDWVECDDYPAPWECASVAVPLDYDQVDGAQIWIAMIRLPAAEPTRRVGSLLLNPGGPGGSGIDLAYGEAESYPQSMVDSFDMVGFDPRGVGQSNAVLCPPTFDPERDSYDDCIDDNRTVLPFLGTSNVARDMDAIREALGDDKISYLGYSYGSALGAVYADMFPNRIRAMVLDGSVDPDAGLSNTASGGSDFYAEQDFDGTIATFEELCDASPLCPAGPSTEDLIRRVRKKISGLPTDRFPGGVRLTRSDLDDILTDAMYSAFTWPVLALALEDADNGDASTLAALNNYLLFGYPPDVDAEFDLEFANVAIRCADFSNRGNDSYECENFPDSADALPVITAVDASAPILVVGTKGDPATPARYSRLMAAALGDAVAIEWEGAGHTATLSSRCITDIVAAYLVDVTVPDDGTSCPFVTGVTSFPETADAVFAGPDREMTTNNIADVLVAQGEDEEFAACVATQLAVRADRRLVIDELLGIESPHLVALRTIVERGCTGG